MSAVSPSPTGPLHFGSLLAATASCLQALSSGGQWLIRIEDIDPPREQPGAVTLIMDALDAYGFEWHGPVTFQSQRRQQHLDAIETLQQQGFAYRCGCSRRDLAEAPQGALGTIYPGTCRDGTVATRYAIRLRTNDEAVCFSDGLQGPQAQHLESESGDSIIAGATA
ncbi:MAG: glutamate--tRNA ligase family protein [Woeseiaceae bacterium]|nr:glutamate--tRNA ligase family protein [Woeseiaceae bacterium]